MFLLGYFYYMMLLLSFYLFLSVIVFPRHINKYICLVTVGFMLMCKCLIQKKENIYGFSVDYNYIGKSDILNIHKYLMTKDNIK